MILVALVIVLVAVNIILLTITGKHAETPSGLGRLALVIVSPFQKQLTAFFQFCKELYGINTSFLVSKAEENERLKDGSGSKLATAQSLQPKLSWPTNRLRHLIDFEDEVPLTDDRRPSGGPRIHLPGRRPSPWARELVNGVRQGAPVLVPEGIVGVVVEASARYAKVLLADRSQQCRGCVGAANPRAGHSQGAGVPITVCLTTFCASMKSALAIWSLPPAWMACFPKGFRVGRISEIVRQNAGIFQKVSVTPYVDFEILEEVFVVSEPASEDLPGES
jgi:rod shape-determining protein MreC